MSATLLLEIGNTAWKLARYHQYQTPEFLSKGYGIDDLFNEFEKLEFDELAMANVGPEEHFERIKLYAETANKVLFEARTSSGFGIQHCYSREASLGVDRWLTLLLAKSEQTAAIIIDAGTAITLDVIDEKGQHLGGWIAPGMHLMQEALVRKSTRLRVSDETPTELLGSSTENAIHLGCKASLNGFVEQALVAAQVRLTQAGEANTPKVWLTGGDVPYLGNPLLPDDNDTNSAFLERLKSIEQRPNLVLEGLAVWYQQVNKIKAG
ncbi:type III pantothenate kinase [Aliidiomarina iranensis]|uniref:type III pantothenate kinase n=1 Tax=Aliidiomarina iranensis TaxID=1434071 RepID=UPI0013001A15|nr:type III pantothenate kinase [Aliidiomarina iranensis]